MGLVSSLHCIGMCGPIALAMPVHRGNFVWQAAGLLTYNLGRAGGYALLGMLVGSLGASLAWIGLLQYLSIAAGIVMLFYVFWPGSLNRYLKPPVFWVKLISTLKKKMALLLQSRRLDKSALLGFLNGLLPCGMVYMALLSSVATGSTAGGAIYMLLFGLGTFPAMLAVGLARQKISPAVRSRINHFTPFVLALAGIWLVARGIWVELPQRRVGSSSTVTVCK
ncbi:sulfite exporter TauE/SafE family protein [Dyadobacter sp. UC 10]|nr:sulfite exporter TauE/SafE family protein [Dyadobacter sp. UC 10]